MSILGNLLGTLIESIVEGIFTLAWKLIRGTFRFLWLIVSAPFRFTWKLIRPRKQPDAPSSNPRESSMVRKPRTHRYITRVKAVIRDGSLVELELDAKRDRHEREPSYRFRGTLTPDQATDLGNELIALAFKAVAQADLPESQD